jgi:phosphoglycerate dehydrogenase-like enzyme
VDKAELFGSAFVVSLHLVLAESTRGIVGANELRTMRPDAYLINTARAGLVEQEALARALAEGWIAGAGLDVYDVEPLPREHWARRTPQAVISPHMGYVTRRNFELFYADAVEDIAAYLAGTPMRQLDLTDT